MVNLLVATTYVQGTREVDRRLRLQPRTDCADRTTVVSLSLSLTSHLSLLHSIIREAAYRRWLPGSWGFVWTLRQLLSWSMSNVCSDSDPQLCRVPRSRRSACGGKAATFGREPDFARLGGTLHIGSTQQGRLLENGAMNVDAAPRIVVGLR